VGDTNFNFTNFFSFLVQKWI